MRKTGIALAVGLAVGLCFSAIASRNSAGTYSLPTGNPVVTGTTITSTWANNTLSDLKTEITNSLDRNGRGAMLAPLQCSSGTAAAPSLTFSADPDTGLYRIGANNPAIAAGGVEIQEWSSTGSTFPLACTITGAATIAGGVTVTQSTANGAGATATGNGTGSGVVGIGGATGNGANFTAGGGNTTGVVGVGAGSGAGGSFIGGGSTGNGVSATGGTGGGIGLVAFGTGSSVGATLTGAGTSAGATIANGSNASAGTRRDALTISNGDINLSGVTEPSSTTALSDRITPLNVVKAWGYLDSGAGTPVVSAGFNIASASCASSVVTITFASAFSSTNFAVVATAQQVNSGEQIYASPVTSTTAVVKITNGTGTLTDMCAASRTFSFIALGAQ